MGLIYHSSYFTTALKNIFWVIDRERREGQLEYLTICPRRHFSGQRFGERSISHTCYDSDYTGTQTCKQPALTHNSKVHICKLWCIYTGTLFKKCLIYFLRIKHFVRLPHILSFTVLPCFSADIATLTLNFSALQHSLGKLAKHRRRNRIAWTPDFPFSLSVFLYVSLPLTPFNLLFWRKWQDLNILHKPWFNWKDCNEIWTSIGNLTS